MSIVPVFVDDATLASAFGGTQWEHQTDEDNSYAGTLTICHAGNTGTEFSLPPSFTAFFAGTDVFMYGTLTKGVAASYSIDFGPSQAMSFSSSTIGKPGVELWRLTGLTSAYHTLQIMPTAGDLTIDYLTYAPTSLTLLDGNDLILDDQHPALQYSKGWVVTSNEQYPQGTPYLGTTTGTSTEGSSMQLNFNGEFVAVYGALQQVPGILTLSFSVDNAAPTIYTPWNGTQTNSSVWSVAFQMFQASVSPGSHTLRVSLQQATGSQMLWLDSVITEAAIATTLSNAAGGSGSGSSVGTTGVGGISPVPTLGTTTPTFNTHTRSRSRISGGAIGGIAGGVSVFLAIALFFLRRCIRAGRSKPTKASPPMAQVPIMSTTPPYSPASPPYDTPAASPPPTTEAHSDPSLQEALRRVFGHQQGVQTPPLQTNWETDDVSSNPTQPSHQGSSSHLRDWTNHPGQV